MAASRGMTHLIGLRASVTVDSLRLFTAHTGWQKVPPTCQYRETLSYGPAFNSNLFVLLVLLLSLVLFKAFVCQSALTVYIY